MRTEQPRKTTVAVYFIGVLGTFMIMIALVAFMKYYTRPAPLEQPERAAERAKNLQELNAANAEFLSAYAWINEARGTVRLPISRAMDVTVQLWKNPAAGRSNLIQRVDKLKAPISYE